MGDRNSFAMMPQIVNAIDTPTNGNIANRGVEFSHENEIAHPDYYSVKLNNGITSEIAPGDHSAIFRFSFPDSTQFGSLVFDSGKNDGQYADKYWYGTSGGLSQNNEFAGYVDNGTMENDQRKNGGSRMFIYGVFSNSDYQVNTCSDDALRQSLNFKLGSNKTLEVKFATSYISVEQAKNNLQQEVSSKNYDFDDLRKATQTV
jgi:putative alpha-1,2-mannosidase